jgi:hypothetical protein
MSGASAPGSPGALAAPQPFSLVIPAFAETGIGPVLDGFEAVCAHVPHEILVVVDTPDDATVACVAGRPGVRVVVSSGRGPAQAIRAGLAQARYPIVVTAMADGCDEPATIAALVELVAGGCVVAGASRNAVGGSRAGGARVKTGLSRGLSSLLAAAGVPSTDATNGFRAYDRDWVRSVPCRSEAGFTIGLELTARAVLAGREVGEVPTVWKETRPEGSRFRMARWAPAYAYWSMFAVAVAAATRRATPLGVTC